MPNADEGQIRTFVNRGRGGTFWLALKNFTNNPEVDKALTNLGYRVFRGSFTKQIVPDNIDQVKTELNTVATNLGVSIDFSALDDIQVQLGGLGGDEQGGETPTQQLTEFMQQLRNEMAKTPANEQAQMMGAMIEKRLEELANSTDEAAKSEFIKEFFEFSARFWNYSFSNQMLIFFQSKGEAYYVRGKKQWQGMGRQVRQGETPISILAPSITKGKITDKAVSFVLSYVNKYNRMNPSSVDHDLSNPDSARKFFGFAKKDLYPQNRKYLYQTVKANRLQTTDEVAQYLERKQQAGGGDQTMGGMRFKAVSVYDIEQTDPIPGKKAFEPPARDVWQSKFNEPEGRANALISAAASFAANKGIDVDFSAETGSAGGYSSGGSISTNYESQGQRRLGTLIHEIAHELLHWNPDTRLGFTKQDKEIDAESVAYIVMRHFGFEADYSANYLAFHKATSKEMRQRKDFIAKAVKEIITGIRKEVLGEEKKALSGSWYKRALCKPLWHRDIIPELASEFDHAVFE